MSERLQKLEEIASLAAEAVASDDSGELPYYLLGRKNFNRLLQLLVETGNIAETFATMWAVDEKPPKEHKPQTSKLSSALAPPDTVAGNYTVRYSYEA